MKTISLIALVAPVAASKSAIAKDYTSLKEFGWTPRGTILGKCVGDCDHNGHCKGGLVCFQRGGTESVPGCRGSGTRGMDFCTSQADINKHFAHMRKDYSSLKEYGWTPASSTLGKCVGDCDNDGHCKGGLVCFQRGGTESVPGCSGKGTRGMDFCTSKAEIDKAFAHMKKDYTSLKEFGWTPQGSTLGKCVGDCDHDGHCKGGLKCFQRTTYETVPGCSGRGTRGMDFCYDPNPRTARPTKQPTNKPTDAPTKRCDVDNCVNWSCADWCECYDDSKADLYMKHKECQDDGVDTCVCRD